MLHKLISILSKQLHPSEWRLMLTVYELAKGDWVHRRTAFDSADISYHTSNVSSLMNKLMKLGYMEQSKRQTAPSIQECFIKLTSEGKSVLVGAFKSSQA